MTTINVKAIYNYTGRNQKELSFSAGEILQVAEKTSDGNWWDGFHNGKRVYVPVTYVEIIEQKGASSISIDPSNRKVSPQPVPTSYPSHLPISTTCVVPSVFTVPDEPLSLPQPHVDSPETAIANTFKPTTVSVQSATLPNKENSVPAPAVPKPSADNVKSKMARYLSRSQPVQAPVPSPDTPAQPPIPGHHRANSEGSNLEYRSVKQLAQAYNQATTEKGCDYLPSPTRPKPYPSAELAHNKEALEQAINFPIVPHAGTTVSLLQQKIFDAQNKATPTASTQQQQSKPAVLTKPKGSFRKHPRKVRRPPPPQVVTLPKDEFVSPPSS